MKTEQLTKPGQFTVARAMLLIATYAMLLAAARPFGIEGLLAVVIVGACITLGVLIRVTFTRLFLLASVSWTAVAVSLEVWDRGGWGAMGIATLYGPAFNLLAAVGGIGYIVVRRLRNDSFNCIRPLTVVIVSALVSGWLIYKAGSLAVQLRYPEFENVREFLDKGVPKTLP